jgi:hypothetical protein
MQGLLVLLQSLEAALSRNLMKSCVIDVASFLVSGEHLHLIYNSPSSPGVTLGGDECSSTFGGVTQ